MVFLCAWPSGDDPSPSKGELLRRPLYDSYTCVGCGESQQAPHSATSQLNAQRVGGRGATDEPRRGTQRGRSAVAGTQREQEPQPDLVCYKELHRSQSPWLWRCKPRPSFGHTLWADGTKVQGAGLPAPGPRTLVRPHSHELLQALTAVPASAFTQPTCKPSCWPLAMDPHGLRPAGRRGAGPQIAARLTVADVGV